MNLVSQWLWLGLLTLPAILLLHLLRERSKRQPISSLELWRWLEKELRGPRLRRLPVTWILFLQLLAALGLNLALTRPEFTWARSQPPRQHFIFVVDTSGSMAAQDAPPSRLAQAQSGIGARLAALGESDMVTLITAGPAAQQVARATTAEAGEVAARVAGLRAAGDGSDWAGALALAAAAVEPNFTNTIIVYTDGAFAAEGTASEGITLPAEVELNLIGQPQGNQAVVTLAVRPTPSGAVQVYARLANFANQPVERAVSLVADGRVRDELALAMPASGVTEQAWTLPPGVKTVSVGLGGQDVLPGDDTAAVGVVAGTPLRAVLVAAEPEADTTLALQRALQSLPNLELETVNPDNYAPYENYDLTVFHGWLPEAWPRGGVLVVAPPEGAGLLPAQVPTTVSALPAGVTDALLADADLTHVDFGRAAALDAPDWLTPVLTDAQGLTLIWHGASDETRLVVFAFGLERGNLARRTAFPVLVANAVAEVAPPPLPEAVSVGQPITLPPAHRLPFLTLTDPRGNEQTFSADREPLFTETFQPGLYRLRGQMLSGQIWEGGFGVNAGSATESDLRVSAQPVLNALAQAGTPPPLPGDPPLDLWPWFVLAVLAIMVAEAWLAWR